MGEFMDEWARIDQCRRTVHDLVCPSYILDRNYQFLDWNVMFDELVLKAVIRAGLMTLAQRSGEIPATSLRISGSVEARGWGTDGTPGPRRLS